jgi:hypothetical protein
MQIKGAEASAHAWRDGSPKCMAAMEPRAINDRSGHDTAGEGRLLSKFRSSFES